MEPWLHKIATTAKTDVTGTKKVGLSVLMESALESGLPLREVEARCLESGIIPEHYERSIGSLGLDGQARLLRSHFAVAGCGGLGGLIVDLLARSGIGHLSLADGDRFSESNLNRQILCSTETLGMSKVEVARAHVNRVNPAAEVNTLAAFLDDKNMTTFLNGVDIVLDALDNNRSRRMLFRACASRDIPVIHGAIGGFWGQVQNLWPGDRSLLDMKTGEVEDEKGIEVRMGNPPFTPALIASLQVAEAIKVFLSLGKPIPSGSLLWIDIENSTFSSLALFPRNQSSP